MKHLYFSLHEIHEYLDIHRMNNMVEEESLTDVKRLLAGKLEELKKREQSCSLLKMKLQICWGKLESPTAKTQDRGSSFLFVLAFMSSLRPILYLDRCCSRSSLYLSGKTAMCLWL